MSEQIQPHQHEDNHEPADEAAELFENSTLGSTEVTEEKLAWNVIEAQKAKRRAIRAHAINALYGNVSPDMVGKTEEELRAIAEQEID